MSFILAIFFFVTVLCLSGIDIVTALGAVVGAITSFGPGLTEKTGPTGNYAEFQKKTYFDGKLLLPAHAYYKCIYKED